MYSFCAAERDKDHSQVERADSRETIFGPQCPIPDFESKESHIHLSV